MECANDNRPVASLIRAKIILEEGIETNRIAYKAAKTIKQAFRRLSAMQQIDEVYYPMVKTYKRIIFRISRAENQ